MATLGSKLMTTVQPWHANMTEQNHLGLNLWAKPHIMEGYMDQLFSAQNYYSDNPLSSILLNYGLKEEEIGTTEWEWTLEGADTRPLVVVENVEPSSNITPGRIKTTFKLKLDENWFVPGDVIGCDPDNLCRVQDQVQRHGDGWVYILRQMTDDPNKFVPSKYLTPGAQWSKYFSQYEEAAEQSGSTQYSGNITLKNGMSKYRKQYKVTDYAATEILRVAIPGPDGKLYRAWIPYAEVKFHKQWYRELELGKWYSNKATTVLGANGRPVRASASIREQLQDSHIHHYSVLSAKMIEEYLMDIFYGRVKPGQGRSIKAFTGEYGMLQFHRAIENKIGANGFIKNFADHTLTKVKSDLNANALGFGYQFVEYYMANGCKLTLVHNPLYDDRTLHHEIDPVTGYPIESQRFTFLDFAGEDGKANIKITKKKDGFSFHYVNGSIGPTGPLKGGFAAHSGDYYEMHYRKDEGVHIKDVTRCGELILSRG